MIEQSDIERVVMRRVHVLRILGLIISTGVLAALTFVAALWGVGREVWVAHVFSNMPHSGSLFDLARFWFATFMNTRFIVQVLSILTFASLVYLILEVARFLKRLISP